MDPAERVFMYLPNHVCVYLLFIVILLRAARRVMAAASGGFYVILVKPFRTPSSTHPRNRGIRPSEFLPRMRATRSPGD